MGERSPIISTTSSAAWATCSASRPAMNTPSPTYFSARTERSTVASCPASKRTSTSSAASSWLLWHGGELPGLEEDVDELGGLLVACGLEVRGRADQVDERDPARRAGGLLEGVG